MSLADPPTRVYLPEGADVHLLRNLLGDGDAYCGATPKPDRILPPVDCWWGTGSQDEYEEAERRLLCPKCAEVEAHYRD